ASVTVTNNDTSCVPLLNVGCPGWANTIVAAAAAATVAADVRIQDMYSAYCKPVTVAPREDVGLPARVRSRPGDIRPARDAGHREMRQDDSGPPDSRRRRAYRRTP